MPALRAAIYGRQSLDRTGEGAAVDRQIEDCRRLIDQRGWTLVREPLTDNDVSASSGKRRPGFEELLTMVDAGRIDVIVVWAVDRLVRRVIDLEDVIIRCERTGVRIATVQGDLDLMTPQGQLNARIMASTARFEVQQKAARQKRANEQRAANGHMGWTRRPFGYDRDEAGRIVVMEDEAKGLREAAEMVLNGSTLAAAVRMLDERGLLTTGRRVLRSPTGEPLRDADGATQHGPFLPWNVTSLRRALLSPRYSGRVTYNGADVAEGSWPVLLDAETQTRLAEVLRDVGRRVQQGTEAKYLLSGVARCGNETCQKAEANGEPPRLLFSSPMGAKGKRWIVYKCRACYLARRADLVDAVVEAVLLARLSQPDAASVLAPSADLDGLRAKVVELRGRRDDLAALLAEGVLSAAAVGEQAKKLTARINDLEDRISDALGDSPAVALVNSEDVETAWDDLDVRSRKAAVDALMTVTVLPAGKGRRFTPEQVRIDWRQ
ncbi:Site-specific DNA recombinase [Geodermatophilus obscurus]|uniref:Site-specific DNA recombinase n=1 Tax=Geodermatophilus obscurus TaxID=1861 RepID=A0A1M7SVZ2_9ACTN|nr:recombinase family protein [Geodermatophilus obscurus]SHN62649.1 Site-specific DNA recombinase [Geodermatophilus obscurus]